MNSYTLKNLSEYTRLNEQMIILWNKKFKIFEGEKIDKNTVFNQNHFEKLIIISFLVESNKKYTVEILSKKPIYELKLLLEFEVQNYILKNTDYTPIIELLICSCFSYDSRSFDTILSICFHKIGIEKCCVSIVFPLIHKLSIVLERNNLQESVISFSKNLIQKHLFFLIKSVPYSENNDRKWLLFLPKNETHNLELLYSYLLLKINKEVSYNLGADFNLMSVIEFLENIEITHIFTFINEDYDKQVLAEYLISIKRKFPEITIIVATYNPLTEKITEEVSYINVNNPTEFNSYLQKIMSM